MVGEHSFDRAEIEGVDVPADAEVAAIAPAPRGSTLVGVRVAGGGVLGVPSRRPEELAAVLGFRAAPVLLDVRPAEPADLPGLPELETPRRHGVLGRRASDRCPLQQTVETLRGVARRCSSRGGPPSGFARIEVVDDGAHLESAVGAAGPHAAGGRGGAAGTRVHVGAWRAATTHITLCTFADVRVERAVLRPARFRRGAAAAQWTPGIAARRDRRCAAGLDGLGPRIVMRRTLTP